MQRCGVGLNKGLFRLISLALLLTLVLAVLVPGTARANPGWYDSNWQYRKGITINSANVSADLTSFPVLISLAGDSDLASYAQTDGNDILFTAADEVTKLSHEIESFNGTSGKLVAWVKIPSLSSSTDTDIYMYYGNSGAGNQENAAAVWDSNYKMVQHLQEASGGANAIKDSTSNANHGTDNNSPTFNATGQINSAIGFDGSDDYIDLGNAGAGASLSITGNLTIEAWIKRTSINSIHTIVDKDYSHEYFFRVDSANKLFLYQGDGSWESVVGGTDIGTGWTHVALTRDVSTKQVSFYINGAQDGAAHTYTKTVSAGTNKVTLAYRHDYPPNYQYFDGTLDEVRISDNARSVDWILTGYNNQSNPSGFITLGSEEAGGAPAVVGGIVYPVDKVQVLAPWLLLFLGLSLAATGGALKLRQRAWSRFN